MKKLFINIFTAVGKFLSYIFPYSIGKFFTAARDKTYTGYISRRFAKLGKGSFFMYRPHHLLGEQSISIGENDIFEPGLQLTAWEKDSHKILITIGNNCLFRRNAHITAVESISIGDNLLTGTNVFITDNSHGTTDINQLMNSPHDRAVISQGAVKIGNNVWLGNNVCIMPGITIGNGAIIGANSVVTHDVPPLSVAAGCPARIIKQYSDHK